jgi:hypothetical protein
LRGAALATLIVCHAAVAAQPTVAFPWHPGDPAPGGAEALLGIGPAELVSRFGQPDRDHPFTARASTEFAYYYKSQAKTYVGTQAAGVGMVVFCTPEAGDLGGARIGDGLTSVKTHWGAPPVQAGEVGIYQAGTWMLEAELAPDSLSLKLAAIVRSGTSLAFPDGQLMLDEFCPHQGGMFPWRAGDPPPDVAGMHLGESRAEVEAALGKPDDDKVPGGKPKVGEYFLNYVKRGITVIGTPGDGVSVVTLGSPSAGDFSALRVGDPVNLLLDRWGFPPVQDGPIGIYSAGVWGVVTKLDSTTNRIKSMYISWTSLKWPDTKGTKPNGGYRLQ